jgi:hypothetical protein
MGRDAEGASFLRHNWRVCQGERTTRWFAPAFGAVLAVSIALRLAPYWDGYRRVWGDQDDWVHLFLTERLQALGPAGLLRAFWTRELNEPESGSKHPWPPLLYVVTAEASYLIGMEWAVRLAPILFWTLAALWLYRLGRAWSLPPRDALLAVALAGGSIELVRLCGLHYYPQSLSAWLAAGLVLSAWRLAQRPGLGRGALTSVWTALTVVGYGANLFHIGGVLLVGAILEVWLRRRTGALAIPAAVAAGFLLALPHFLVAGHVAASPLDYFQPNAIRRVVRLGELASYPVLIGPVVLVLAAVAVRRIREGWQARESWALWLSSWILVLFPQVLVWVFAVPGPPPRLLVLWIPALALAAALGFRELAGRQCWTVPQAHFGRVVVVLLSVLVTVGFLVRIELPRRRVPDGEIEMYRAAARLPAGSVVYVPWNKVFRYYASLDQDDISFRDWGSWTGAVPRPYYWLSPGRFRSRVPEAASRGRVVFESGGNRIVLVERD